MLLVIILIIFLQNKKMNTHLMELVLLFYLCIDIIVKMYFLWIKKADIKL